MPNINNTDPPVNTIVNNGFTTDNFLYTSEMTYENIHKKLQELYGIEMASAIKYIADDGANGEPEYNNKVMEAEVVNTKTKMLAKEVVIELSKEEIAKAIVKNPIEVLTENYLRDRYNHSEIFPIGFLGYGRLERNDSTNIFVMVIGHIIDNKVYNDNKSGAAAYKSANSSTRLGTKYILVNLFTSKIFTFGYELRDYLNTMNINNSLEFIRKLKYKITSSELSGRVFGFPNVKKDLIGKTYTPIKFEKGFSKKLDAETYYIIVHDKDVDKNLKFCIADLEIVLPDVRGYNFPKDKTINIGTLVTLKVQKDNRVEDNNVYKVVAVYPNSTSKKLNKNSQTRQLDVLQLVGNNTGSGIMPKVYAKNVKIVIK